MEGPLAHETVWPQRKLAGATLEKRGAKYVGRLSRIMRGRQESGPVPAKDLYTSEWFRRARAYVEASGAPWLILSAKHGLVSPDEMLEPYEETLNTMSIGQRRTWAERVRRQMDQRVPDADRIVALAGQRYREFLMDYLRRQAPTVEVPLEGLRIGEHSTGSDKQENMRHLADLTRFYYILDHIEARLNGKRSLADDQRGVIWLARPRGLFLCRARRKPIRYRNGFEDGAGRHSCAEAGLTRGLPTACWPASRQQGFGWQSSWVDFPAPGGGGDQEP